MAKAKRKRKKACGSRGRFKSGPRKGRCRPKKTSRKTKARRKIFCVRIKGKRRSIRCYTSWKPATKKAAKLRSEGWLNVTVKTPGSRGKDWTRKGKRLSKKEIAEREAYQLKGR